MKEVSRLLVAGIVATIAGFLVLLALTLNYVFYGYWVALSMVDAIALMSPDISAPIAIWLSESDVLFFIFADSPLYAFLLAVGIGVLIAHILLKKFATKGGVK